MRSLCRDCFEPDPGTARCRRCGSPRLVHHPRLGALAIAHVDCDAFYAAIEKREDPSLVEKPVIVGGGRRGVVATACYIARLSGVRSAMPMFKALKLCPDAVVVPPRMALYSEVGRAVAHLMDELTPMVQRVSIDEAFLDLSGTERVHDLQPAQTLARFAARVERELGITVSIGLSENKFLAKIASEIDKPRGFAALAQADAPAFLAPRSLGIVHGIGAATLKRFAAEGLQTVGQVQRLGQQALAQRFGAEGLRLYELAHGIDRRPVRRDGERKSVSAETTFDVDLRARADLERELYGLCERVAKRLKAADLAGSRVTLKLRASDFSIRTRARTLSQPTRLTANLFAVARDLLAAEADGTSFRLIGIGASGLTEGAKADPPDLAGEVKRASATESAVDRLRDRFGAQAIIRGRMFEPDGTRRRRT